MAQAVQTVRGFVAMPFIPILAASLLLATLLVVVALDPFTVRAPAADGGGIRPAVMQAAREWERQRIQQSADSVDPLTQSGLEWERQRRQQSGYDW